VSIDMSPAFIKGCGEHLPNARITFDKFPIVWHASTAVDKMRHIEQRSDRSLKGMRWSLLKDRSRLSTEAAADLDGIGWPGCRPCACRSVRRDPIRSCRRKRRVPRNVLGIGPHEPVLEKHRFRQLDHVDVVMVAASHHVI
jgi:hypothetical protein